MYTVTQPTSPTCTDTLTHIQSHTHTHPPHTHAHNPHHTLIHRYTHTHIDTYTHRHTLTHAHRDTLSLTPSTHTHTQTPGRSCTYTHRLLHSRSLTHTRRQQPGPWGWRADPGRLVSPSGLFPGSGSDPDPWTVPCTQWAPGGAGEGAGPPLVGGRAQLVQERMPVAVWRRWSRATVPVLGWGVSRAAAWRNHTPAAAVSLEKRPPQRSNAAGGASS